jgi:hypothetical protein
MQKYANVLKRLREFGVKYLVIGGHSVIAHGFERVTFDLDIAIDPDATNAERLIRALHSSGIPGAENLSVDELISEVGYTLYADIGVVDIHASVPGLDFDKAYARRHVARYGDVEADISAVEDLISMKEAIGRPRDLVDLAFLRENYEIEEDD